mgnify:CR=1 FL=1
MPILVQGANILMFKDLKQKIKGPVFSIITPFKDDESVDYLSLKNYVNFLYENGARIFYVMAYNSRFSLLSDYEILKVNETVTSTVKSFNDDSCVTIVADPLHCSTETSIEFAKHAESIGADVISLIFREKVYFEDQVFQHYKKVSENCSVGILIHQMPLNNGIPGQPPTIRWSCDLTSKIADLPNVVAIKEDTKDDDYTELMIETLRDRLAIITSGKGMKQWLRLDGKAHGFLSGIGCFCPQLEIDVFKSFNNGDIDRCQSIIDKIEIPFDKVIYKYGWHLGIKSALDCMGIMSRKERMPLIQLAQDCHENICDKMDSIKKSIEELV